MLECEFCKKEMVGLSPSKKFCSQACKQKAFIERQIVERSNERVQAIRDEFNSRFIAEVDKRVKEKIIAYDKSVRMKITPDLGQENPDSQEIPDSMPTFDYNA